MEFRLVEEPGPDRIHPFKKYTRRRNGHAGQIFAARIVRKESGEIAYEMDLMLAGWGEAHDKGQWVKFWLDEDADRHPFHGCSRRTPNTIGDMFILYLVILDDDGTALDETKEQPQRELGARRRALSSEIHLMVTSSYFVQFLREKSRITASLQAEGKDWTPERAKRYVKTALKIEHLSDLDHDAEKRQKFHDMIRKPYERWRGEQ